MKNATCILAVGKPNGIWVEETIIIDVPEGLGDDAYYDISKSTSEYQVYEKYNSDPYREGYLLPRDSRPVTFVKMLDHWVD